MVNAHLPPVNAYLPRLHYFPGVAKQTHRKPGPRKGVPKPDKRALDIGFPDRLFDAMKRRGFVREDGHTLNAELGRAAYCTHATIGQYLNKDNPKTTINALLLLDLCDALSVTPYWLIRKEGTIEDVPLNKIPMQELRHVKQATRQKEGNISDETHRKGTRGSRHAPRA